MMRTTVALLATIAVCSLLTGPPAARAQDMGTPAATPEAGQTAAVYLMIANGGCMPDQLIEATTNIAERVEFHETVEDDDTVEMRSVPNGFTVLAGRELKLEPGGDHLMLIGLREDLTAGDSFELTLSFLYTGDVSVSVIVRADVDPTPEETPPAPSMIGTIRVTDAWTSAAPGPNATPVAVTISS